MNLFFFSSRRRHTRYIGDWSSDVCSSDLVVREYLELRFAGTDVIALPTERVDRVTRYVGGTPPALSALGGREWAATKRKAKKAVDETARELRKLYAARETVQAYASGNERPRQ